MLENFGHGTSFKMDWKGAITGDHTTFGGSAIKQESESEWPAEPQALRGNLGIKTEPEFLIDEPAVKSELEDDSMEHDDASINALESGLEENTIEHEDVAKDLVKSELENDNMEFDDIKTGVITTMFTTMFKPCQTSPRNIDGRPDFKTSVKQTTNKDNARFHMNINKGVKLLTCKMCNYRTWKKDNLKVHKATHLKKKPSGRGRRGRLPKEQMQNDKWINERPFECVKCDYRGVHKDHLKAHMKKHSGEKPYFCDICGYRSKWKANLLKHIPIHSGGKPSDSVYQGPQCSTNSAEKIKHTEKKLFVCHICDYQSNSKGTLTKHVKIHTGEKEEENQSSNYSGMEKMYSEIKVEKNNDEDALESLYFCKVCSYGTTWKRELTKHLASHAVKESLLSDVCGYQDSQEADLTKHKRSHKLELKIAKPYKCNECNYRVHQLSYLKSHKRVHMEETPFVCNVCGYRTRWRANFTKHMKYCYSAVPSLNDSDRTHVEGNVNLKQRERKHEISPAHDRVDRILESEQKNADPSAGSRVTNTREPCSVCFKEPKVYKFRCETCRWFWNSWKKKGCMPPDCSGHVIEGEGVDCLRCRWERYKAESLAWEEKNINHGKIDTYKGPIENYLDQPIQPYQDEMDQFIELASEGVDSSSETSKHQSCSVCYKFFPKVRNFRCRACRVFWSYWQKASKRPDCPGHTTEGEDAHCSGCRWGRYNMVLLSLRGEENINKDG